MRVRILCYRPQGEFYADLPEGETADSLMDDSKGTVRLLAYDQQGNRGSYVTLRRKLIDSVEEVEEEG